MQRLLVDGEGNALRLLKSGERKTKQKHRVVLVAGEPAEVATIRRVFRQFVERGHTPADIAKALNAKRIPSPYGGLWKACHVLTCLRNAAYAKPVRYRRKKARGNEAPDVWVHTPKASVGIVGVELFRRAQQMLG
jgi:hypothetical protein